jgi:hypothetical protein
MYSMLAQSIFIFAALPAPKHSPEMVRSTLDKSVTSVLLTPKDTSTCSSD